MRFELALRWGAMKGHKILKPHFFTHNNVFLSEVSRTLFEHDKNFIDPVFEYYF